MSSYSNGKMADSNPDSEKPQSITESEPMSFSTPAVENDTASLPSEFTLRATLTLSGTFAVLFASVGFINAFGVFQEYYEESFLSSYSPSSISWLGSFNLFCIFAGSLPSGSLTDVFGPRVVIFVGAVLGVLAVFMISLCKEYYQFFLAQGLLLGIAFAALVCPTLANLPLYFKRQRALALGICVAGSSLGGVIWPISIRRLIIEVGFGWALRICAFIMLPLLTFAVLAVRPPIRTGPKVGHKMDLLACAKNPVIIFSGIGFFFIGLGLFTPFFYITPWAIKNGINSNTSFYLISVINAASLLGRVIPGFLADRVGPFNMIVVSATLSAIVASCMHNCTSLASLMIFSLAYGFASGAIISLQGACATLVVEPRHYGTAIGSVLALYSISDLVGTPIVGQILVHSGWLAVILWSGLIMIVGAAFLLAAKLKVNKDIWAKV